MKDTRFKELLNLHLDHRLTTEEARELGQALKTDPARLRTFRSYAAMQRGCSELFRRSAEDAPAPEALLQALRDAEARMREKSERGEFVRGWKTWGVTAGAAAMVVLVVARVSQPTMVADSSATSGESTGSNSPLLAVANAERAGASSDRVSRSSSLPPHLTLAALGINPEQSQGTSLSRWQITEESYSRLDGSHAYPTWAQASAALEAEWRGMAIANAEFSARPINAWSSQSQDGASAFQPASFTFER